MSNAVFPQQHAITDALGQLRDGVSGAVDCLIPAQAVGVTERTVARNWVKARGWLFQMLSDDDA